MPHEELGPPLEFEEAEGDEEDVAAPLLFESALPRAADATTLLVNGGLKMPEKVAKSSFVFVSTPLDCVEPCLCELSVGLTWSLAVRGEAEGRPLV